MSDTPNENSSYLDFTGLGIYHGKIKDYIKNYYAPKTHSHSTATTAASGFMSADDKSKLNGIQAGATKVVESTISNWGFTKNTGTVTTTGTMTAAHVVVSNGGVVIKDSGFTIGTSVPSGAVFTDTVTTATTTGSGNAVTAISATNGALTVTKGSTFLTSHQSATAVNGANVGSATQGTYINASGKPTVMTYKLNKTVPSDAVFTDANVAQNKVTADTSNYPILARDTTSVSTSTGGTNFAPNIYINPYDVSIHASTFVGNLTGNVTGNVSGSSGSCTGNAATASSVAWSGITGVPTASTSAAGIIKIGTSATNAAAGDHAHTEYIISE